MGHLINIANNIVAQCEKSNELESYLKGNLSSDCMTKWEALATNQLADINKTHKIYLVHNNILEISMNPLRLDKQPFIIRRADNNSLT